MVVLDECGPDCDCAECRDSADQFVDHRDGDYLDGLAGLMDRPSPWDEWDDVPTVEKWRRGGRWN